MNYIIGYRRVYSIMHIESVVCVHIACYYYFAKSVHNIHSIVWCVCMCVHVRYCYFVFTAHTCLHLLIQEIYMHNYATFSSQFICIFLNQRITAWFILSNVDVCYVCCRDKQSNNHCTHSFNNVYCVRVCAYVCVWLATCCFTEPHTNIIHNLLLTSQDASVYIYTQNGKWGKDTENWDWRRRVPVRAHSCYSTVVPFPLHRKCPIIRLSDRDTD